MKRLFRQNDDTSMDAVARYVREHFTEDISPESLAKQFHMTSSRLSRSFYDAFQVSPINYAIDLRIERALELMADPALSTKEAAARAGFDDFVHFRTLFTNRVGMTPEQAHREAMRKEPAEKMPEEPGTEVPKENEAAPPEEAGPEMMPGETAVAPETDPADTSEVSESPEALQAWVEEYPASPDAAEEKKEAPGSPEEAPEDVSASTEEVP